MRFMMLMYPGPQPETNGIPDEKAIGRMMKYNEDLAKAGVLISLDGLHPSAKGARVRFDTGTPVVTEGPFTETKELVGGFWMLQVKTKAEAIEWAKRVPSNGTEFVELRQVFDMADFNIDPKSEINAQVERVAAGLEAKKGSS